MSETAVKHGVGGHGLFASTTKSPWARCAGSALALTEIWTQGLVALLVWWQMETFGAGAAAVPDIVESGGRTPSDVVSAHRTARAQKPLALFASAAAGLPAVAAGFASARAGAAAAGRP